MRLLPNLTKNVHFDWYTVSVGVSGETNNCQPDLVKSLLYPFRMILEANMPIEQIDEALKHISESIVLARDVSRKNALYELADALLDAKLEKQGI